MLFSLGIYAANHKLYERIKAMADAGYLAVPGAEADFNMTRINSAFYGALFFTLSVGAFLSLGALAGALVWDRLGGRRRMVLRALCLPRTDRFTWDFYTPAWFCFFVAGSLLEPAAEELFFRGVICGYLRSWGVE
jgi:membrane protease YdiL (CAAX protease family)